MRVGAVDQVLLTRFNVQLAEGDDRGVGEEWLTGRLDLFERVCAPSVLTQGGSRRWIVFVDARTPAAALARIEAACGPAAGVVLPVVGLLPVADLRARVGEVVPLPPGRAPGECLLVSTRLDNDDALAPGHLDAVLAAALESAGAGREEFLNPTRGWQLAGARVHAVRDRSGPFLSLVERRRDGIDPLTAFGVPHRHARASLPVRQLRGGPWWVQVVHGANLVNAIDGVRVDAGGLARALPHLADLLPAVPEPHTAAYRRDQVTSLARTLSRTAARTVAGPLVRAGHRAPAGRQRRRSSAPQVVSAAGGQRRR